jgi:poly(3-hydroxyalkanoate) synthetase
MAKYDLPAAFDYIYNITRQKIHYVGHSQGTMVMFAALAESNSVIHQYLASYSALGPVAYLDN